MRVNRTAAVLVGAAAVAALGLKAFYSRATCAELNWVLRPTVMLVSRITGARFEFEAGQGWLSRDLHYAIVPSCAGVNFLIALFLSLVLGLAGSRRSMTGRVALLPAAFVVAWSVTIVANATRLAVAIPLHRSGLSIGPLTPERIHHVEGTIVYFFFLLVTFAAAVRLCGGAPAEDGGMSCAG